MILTCPQCATRYFLPDAQVGRAGRSVKCTHCGAVWRADPSPEAAERPPPAPPPEPEPRAFAEAEPEPPEEEFAAAAARRAEILRDRKAETDRKARQAAVITTAVWAGLAAAIAVLGGAAVVFRAEVVKLWPGAATAYAAIGMPVNASGLLIDKVQAAPSMLGEHRALTVTGVLTNASAAARPAPAFRVTVLDAAGKALVQRVIQVPAVALKVGEARPFRLQLADPPPGARDVEVTLALPQAAPPAPAGAKAAPAPHPAKPS